MPTSFPGAVDDIQNDVSNSTPLDDVHPGLHNDLADAIMAIETQVLAGGGGGVADGSITSAKIADGTIQAIDLADGAVTSAKIADSTIIAADMAAGAAAGNIGILSGVLGGTLPSPTMAAGAAATNVGTLGGSLSGTLPNPTLAANSVGASQITDGTVGTAELANANVTNAKLASDTARANLLTNGGFEIWQRGNGPFTTTAFAADMWQLSLGAGSTVSISRNSADVDTVGGGSYCAAVTNTHVAISNLISSPTDLVPSLRNRVITLSVRVKTATPSAVRLRINDSVSTPSLGTPHTGSGTYETLSLTHTMSPTATGLSIQIRFEASCTAYIDNAMLVVGSVAANYAPLHPADDLACCQRYYEKVKVAMRLANATTSNQAAMSVLPYKATMAATPSATLGTADEAGNNGTPAFTALSADGGAVYVFSAAAGDAKWIGPVTLESNP